MLKHEDIKEHNIKHSAAGNRFVQIWKRLKSTHYTLPNTFFKDFIIDDICTLCHFLFGDTKYTGFGQNNFIYRNKKASK